MTPPEVLDQIISHLQEDFTSLLTCTLTSSVLCAIAHRYIYRFIELGPRSTKKPNRQQDLLLLYTLKSSTYDYGSLIHHLTLDGNAEDLLEMAPHLTNLKSLTLKSTRSMYIRTLPSYPNPLISVLNKLISQPGFVSFDINNYQLEGGVGDLQHILKGANDLKHLRLDLADTGALSSFTKKSMALASPPSPCTISPIFLESLSLGFRQIRMFAISRGPASHPILNWLGKSDCVVSVEKLRRLKLVNSGWYNVGGVTEKVMDTLECLELVEKEDEKIPEFMIDFGDLVTKRKTSNQWFTDGYFPNLRHVGLSMIPVDKHCVRGSTSIGLPWMVLMLDAIGKSAPNLKTLSLKQHGQFQLPLTPRSDSSSSLSTQNENEYEYDQNCCNMHALDYNYDNDDLPLTLMMKQWTLLCGENIKRCVNLEQLNISFVEGKMLSDMDRFAVMRRWTYAYVSRMSINRFSGFPEERINVELRDLSGTLLEPPNMTLSKEEFEAIRNGSGNTDTSAVINRHTFKPYVPSMIIFVPASFVF